MVSNIKIERLGEKKWQPLARVSLNGQGRYKALPVQRTMRQANEIANEYVAVRTGVRVQELGL